MRPIEPFPQLHAPQRTACLAVNNRSAIQRQLRESVDLLGKPLPFFRGFNSPTYGNSRGDAQVAAFSENSVMLQDLSRSTDLYPTRLPWIYRLQVIYHHGDASFSVLDVLVPSSLKEDGLVMASNEEVLAIILERDRRDFRFAF